MTEFESEAIEKGQFTNCKLALFDVGGVLYRFKGGIEKLAEIMDFPYEKCEAIWRELDDPICRGKIPPQEIWRRIKKDSHYTGLDQDFVPFWVNLFRENKIVHNLIKEISLNRAVGLMQNVYPGVFDLALKLGKVPNIPYAFVLQSCQTGFIKPETQIYELAERKSGFKPQEILFIDDNASFLRPAKSRGWQTFHFNSDNPDSSASYLRTGFAI